MNSQNKKRKKKQDNLSVVIKGLICACAVVAVVVVALTVKVVSDNKDVVPFGSDTSDTSSVSDTAQAVGQSAQDTSQTIENSNDVTTTQVTTTAEPATSSETTTETSTRETTLALSVHTDPSTTAVQTTVASLVDDDNRIVVNPERKLWNLVVVNAGRKMPSGYKPQLAEVCGSGVYMDYRVAPWYDKMYYAAKEDGITLVPYSGYRSYERQERNYNNLTETYMSRYGISRSEAAAKAATVILPPGTSEHNLGLAMDICNTYDSFANQKEYKWLVENAHKYGFILRYEAEKQPITGIVPEPWHWRYVGVEYAEKIKNSGLCLEEYLDSIGVPY